MGLCGVSGGVDGQPVRADPPEQFRCHRCDDTVYKDSNTSYYPFAGPSCMASYKQCAKNASSGLHTDTVHCVVFDCGKAITLRNTSPPDWVRSDCRRDSSKAKKYPKNEAELGGAITSAVASGPQFRARLYGCTGLTHRELSDHIERHRNASNQTSTLVQYAKLYVLANKYMIKTLQDVALHKLHRNLNAFNLHDQAIDDLTGLTLYVYANTSDEGGVLAGTADKLRELVMAYLADRAKDLMKYESFRGMLGAGGALTSDFMALTFGQGN